MGVVWTSYLLWCFPRKRLQRKPLVSEPSMHHGTCVTHVPWCMSGSLTRGVVENVPGIPGAYATHNFTYLVRGPYTNISLDMSHRLDLHAGSTIPRVVHTAEHGNADDRQWFVSKHCYILSVLRSHHSNSLWINHHVPNIIFWPFSYSLIGPLLV